MAIQTWTLTLTPQRKLPVPQSALATQIVDALPDQFWQAMLKEQDAFGEARRLLPTPRVAELVARRIVRQCVVEPHWYVQGGIAHNTVTDRWSVRTPTLFEKSVNQQQFGLDNLEVCLTQAVMAHLKKEETDND